MRTNSKAAGGIVETPVAMQSLFGIFWRRAATETGRRGLAGQTARLKKPKNYAPLPALEQCRIVGDAVGDAVGDFSHDHQRTMNFVGRVCRVFALDAESPAVVSTTSNTSHPLYEVLVHKRVPLPPAIRPFLREDFAALSEVHFFGRGRTVTGARQNAHRHLAACLYKILRAGELFLPATEQNPHDCVPSCEVHMEATLRDRLRALLVDCEAVLAAKETAVGDMEVEVESHVSLAPLDSPPIASTFALEMSPPQGGLPINRHYEEIVRSIAENQVTIVSATTGSGKTTQIPQFILRHFAAMRPSVVVTQPRRVAAISLADRLARELGEPAVGRSVGYSVRFESVAPDVSGPHMRKGR